MVADASTIAPSDSRAIGAALAAKGVDFLDAPCTGSTPGAEGGTLTFMIGGDKEVFETASGPTSSRWASGFTTAAAPAWACTPSSRQNLILSNLLQAFNEGMVLATKAGVDPKLMLEILDNSAAKSGLDRRSRPPSSSTATSAPNFSVKWMHKDIGLMLESGKELGVPLPLTAFTRQMFQAAIADRAWRRRYLLYYQGFRENGRS